MADVLSLSEVESLLSVLDSNSNSSASIDPPSGCDFERPERVSPEQLRSLNELHASVSHALSEGLSVITRTRCEVQLVSVEQLTYGDFVLSLDVPTCFHLIEAKGLDGHLVLDLNLSIVFPIVDRLLGGGPETMPLAIPQRPLTAIECTLASRVTDLVLRAVENAWASVCDLQLRVSQMESDPQRVQIIAPEDIVVLIRFEVLMGERRGRLNLGMPFEAIESHVSQQTAKDAGQTIRLDAGLSRETAEVIVRMATTKLTASDVRNLEVGDVLVTDAKAQDGVEVLIDGVPAFRGFPGTFQNKKAVRVGRSAEG